MRKIFLDVGGYEGESSRAALDPLFGFDHVYCFEPVAACFNAIEASIVNSRFSAIHAGLSNKSGELRVYQAGTVGASIYSDAPTIEVNAPIERATFIRASQFFAEHVAPGDKVWMKLNCEGSECDILEDLITSGEDNKLACVLIDFDVKKIPSQTGREKQILELLRAVKFSFQFPEEVMYGMINNYGGIRNWLLKCGPKERSITRFITSMRYQLPYVAKRRYNGYYKIRIMRMFGLKPPPDQRISELRKDL